MMEGADLMLHDGGGRHDRGGRFNGGVSSVLQAATDLLVRQKHFSVGQPNNEIHITQ